MSIKSQHTLKKLKPLKCDKQVKKWSQSICYGQTDVKFINSFQKSPQYFNTFYHTAATDLQSVIIKLLQDERYNKQYLSNTDTQYSWSIMLDAQLSPGTQCIPHTEQDLYKLFLQHQYVPHREYSLFQL